MKRFIFKIILFSVFVGAMSFILDYMIKEGLKTSNYREITKWNEVIEGGIDAEILIVGSSRALVHFDCEYIQKVTGKTCYNLGFDGTTYPLQKLMLELYLSGNKIPEKIIWSLDYHTFSEAPDYYGFEQLVPFQDNAYISKMLSMHETPAYQFKIPIFRYSYNPKMKVIGLYSFIGQYQRDPILKYGFRKQDKKWDETFERFKQSNPNGHSVNFDQKVFDDFIGFNTEMVKVSSIIWMISPYFFEYKEMIKNRIDVQNLIEKSSIQLQINLLNYINYSLSMDRSNFYNSNHMNKEGVEAFMNLCLKDKTWTN